MFAGIESFTESIQGELVAAYREEDSDKAKKSVSQIPNIIKYMYTEN